MVEVAVGEDNGGWGQLFAADSFGDEIGVVAGIDNDRFVGDGIGN